MTASHAPHPSSVTWTGATWAGWILGVPCIALLALLGEQLHIGGAQTLVGAGMGAGVGLLQARVLRRFGLPFQPWLWSCIAGLAFPFLVWDIAKALGTTWSYSLLACVTSGGLVAGIWQAGLLRSHVGRFWWVISSTLGWGLAGVLATSADKMVRSHAIRGLAGAGAYLALVTCGGVVLGVVTGWVLAHRWSDASSPTME